MSAVVEPYIRFLDVFPFLTTFKEGSIGYDCRIFSVLEGSMNVCVDTHEIQVGKKQLLYIPAGVKYTIKNNAYAHNRIVTINFDFTQKYAGTHHAKISPVEVKNFDKNRMLADTIPESFSKHILFQYDDVLEEEFTLMYHYFLSKGNYTEHKTSSLLRHILYVILEHEEQEENHTSSNLVYEIEQYILCNYTSPGLSNESIAQKYSYNSFYLNTIFKKELNITMHQYVLSLRIKLAKRLIKETKKNMTDIAAEVGFNSSSYFSQVFRKIQGCSPAEYRKTNTDYQG